MSLRPRVIVLVAAAVVIAVLGGCAATYAIVRHELFTDADEKLAALANKAVQQLPPGARITLRGPGSQDQVRTVRKVLATIGPPGSSTKTSAGAPARVGTLGYSEYVDIGGGVTPTPSPLPPSLVRAAVAVATGARAPFTANAHIAGEHVRVLTRSASEGLAVQSAISLGDLDGTLSKLRTALLIVSLCGVGLAGALALLSARAILRPVLALTRAAERISSTRDLSERIDAPTDGELGRLASSFDRMLAALEQSSHAQRQLVADASHELRTPLASLLMNIELLAEGTTLSGEDREKLVRDLSDQVRELGVLVGDLVDLAREEEVEADIEDLRLDLLVNEVVDRARRRAREQGIEIRSEPCIVRGSARQLTRAVSNLLDNAIKWSPPGESIEVSVRGGEVLVRDHGPGIDEVDLPLVFVRFYRARASREVPGAGLGLAIVQKVATNHGGQAQATNAPGGGALVSLALPASDGPAAGEH